MRKVISYVLTLALVLSSFSMAFAATTDKKITAAPSDVVGETCEDAVTVLTALNVVAGYPDGSYKPEQTVTRAELAKLIITALGLEDFAGAATTSFSDMAGSEWAVGYVGYAASLGIIKGYPDGRFGPTNPVSYDEAITMIVRALGYTEAAKEMNGTWPAVFTQKARVLGILDDIKATGNAGANRGDVAIMLFNALTCVLGYADADGQWVAKKGGDGQEVKMIANLDATEVDYEIIKESADALINIKPYVGAYAKTFQLTKGAYEDYIVAVGDKKSDFITGEFKAGDKVLKTSDGTEYKLGSVMNSTEGTTDIRTLEFKNGVAGDTYTSKSALWVKDNDSSNKIADGEFVTFAANLSGKTVNGIYSLMKWTSNAEAVVDADDIKDITDNKKFLGKDFPLDDDDAIDTTDFELFGVDSLADIKAGNVAYVYTDQASKDEEITRIAVGTKTVEGEVTKTSGSTGSEKVTIDGKAYEFASNKIDGITAEVGPSDISAEDVVTLYLDAYGYIYDSNTSSGKADDYAVVLEVGEKGSRIGDDAQIKLFTNAGEAVTFDVDSDAFEDNVDGIVEGATSSKDGTWSTKLFDRTKDNPGAVGAGTIVKYGVNKSGDIDNFEAVKTGNAGTSKDITEKGYYNGYEIAKNAVVFSYDFAVNATGGDKTDKDNYAVTTLEKVLDTDKVAVNYVYDNKDKIVAMLIFDYQSSDDTYGVITDKSTNNSDAGYEIEFFIDGKAKTINSNKTGYNKADTSAKNAFTLWKIDFDATGDVKDLKDATGTSDLVAHFEYKAGDSVSYSSRVFTTSNSSITVKTPLITDDKDTTTNRITLDKDAVLYYNDGGDFKVGGLSDLRNIGKDNAEAYFFDTQDDDGIYDVVIVNNKY